MVWNHCISTWPEEKMGSLRGQNSFILEGELGYKQTSPSSRLFLCLSLISLPILSTFSCHSITSPWLAHTFSSLMKKWNATQLPVIPLLPFPAFLQCANGNSSLYWPLLLSANKIRSIWPFRRGLTGCSLSLPVKASQASLIANSYLFALFFWKSKS